MHTGFVVGVLYTVENKLSELEVQWGRQTTNKIKNFFFLI
jgi:hypothetical protein